MVEEVYTWVRVVGCAVVGLTAEALFGVDGLQVVLGLLGLEVVVLRVVVVLHFGSDAIVVIM